MWAEAESSEVKGEIKAQLSGLAAKLADVGIPGSGSINNEQYQNVLRKDLPIALQNNATCNTKYSIRFRQSSSVRLTDRQIQTRLELQKTLKTCVSNKQSWALGATLKPPPSSGVPEFELLTTYVRDGEAIQRGSAIYQGQKFPIAISGKWSIRSGILHYKVESSNVAFLISRGVYV